MHPCARITRTTGLLRIEQQGKHQRFRMRPRIVPEDSQGNGRMVGDRTPPRTGPRPFLATHSRTVLAASGLVLLGFVILHMLGNLHSLAWDVQRLRAFTSRDGHAACRRGSDALACSSGAHGVARTSPCARRCASVPGTLHFRIGVCICPPPRSSGCSASMGLAIVQAVNAGFSQVNIRHRGLRLSAAAQSAPRTRPATSRRCCRRGRT